jgi:DmsE family decaheme c-type cytochrome
MMRVFAADACPADAGEQKMKRLHQIAGLCVFVLSCGAAASATAGQAGPVKAALDKDAVCTSACHGASWRTPLLSIYQTRHGNKADSRTPGCQDCHGASVDHRTDPGKTPDVVFGANSKHISTADARSAACLKCHESSVLPRANWTGSQHQMRGLACTSCHNLHAPDQKVLSKATQAEVCFACHKTQRAQTRRISTHPLAVTGQASTAKMACSDCHNPHGSPAPKMLVKNTVNETCYTCHAEKRGPFLWEHAPVVDDCTNCHTPHGSTNASLLKARAPWLCQECHTGDHGAQINSGANLGGGAVTTINGTQQPGAATPRAQSAARACLNCHVLIHGSNHPAGAKFQR